MIHISVHGCLLCSSAVTVRLRLTRTFANAHTNVWGLRPCTRTLAVALVNVRPIGLTRCRPCGAITQRSPPSVSLAGFVIPSGYLLPESCAAARRPRRSKRAQRQPRRSCAAAKPGDAKTGRGTYRPTRRPRVRRAASQTAQRFAPAQQG